MNPRDLPADYHDLPTMPAELLNEFDDTGFASIDDIACTRLGVKASQTPLAVDVWTLSRFRALMAEEGWPVHAARMLFDRVYAHERLAFAHSSANQILRDLALDLFRRMHAEDGLSH